MIEQLFGSKTRVKLLQLFYSNPNRSFYVREITRKVDEQINSVRRELSNLLNVGIISSENTNNRLYYEVNKSFEFYQPLSEIFGSGSAVAADDEGSEATAALKSLGNVEMALYTGQFTRDERSGVDFVVVGDINQTQISKYVSELEAKEGKAIRFTVMSKDEFLYRKEVNDRFLLTLLESKLQVILDKDNLLGAKASTNSEESEADKPSRTASPASKDKREKPKK